MKKIALAIAAVAAMILGFGGVANAYPPGGPNVTVSPSTVGPGGTVTVTANCTAGESVTITLEASSVTVPCEADTATGNVTAPTAVGTFTGSVTGTVSGPLGTFEVSVVSAGPPNDDLPATGSDGTSTITIMAVGLLVVGLGLFAVASIRRKQQSTAA